MAGVEVLCGGIGINIYSVWVNQSVEARNVGALLDFHIIFHAGQTHDDFLVEVAEDAFLIFGHTQRCPTIKQVGKFLGIDGGVDGFALVIGKSHESVNAVSLQGELHLTARCDFLIVGRTVFQAVGHDREVVALKHAYSHFLTAAAHVDGY